MPHHGFLLLLSYKTIGAEKNKFYDAASNMIGILIQTY